MNLLSNLILFYTRKIEPGFRINKDSLVIDIGSGDKPFWRADVFIDNLSLGNVQRASRLDTIHNLGMFVNGDAKKMPFIDGAFDFSFSSHLLEHVDNPAAVIEEITRISKAGYLEVPNGILETIKPFNSHLWFVFSNKNKLIFVRKSQKMHKLLLANGITYDYLLGNIKEPFIRMYWKKTIKYEIIDDLTQSEKFKSEVGDDNKTSSYNFYLSLVMILRFIFYKNKLHNKIKSTLKNNRI